jgi:hypothetical protein
MRSSLWLCRGRGGGGGVRAAPRDKSQMIAARNKNVREGVVLAADTAVQRLMCDV